MTAQVTGEATGDGGGSGGGDTPGDGQPADGRGASENDEAYAGLVGAFRYAFRRSESYLFRSYALASALLGALLSVLLVLGLVVWLANPTGLIGERALLGVVAILLLVPLFAPVLLVARRHRRADGAVAYDRALGAAGYLFVGSAYAGLVISVPPAQQTEPGGALAPVAAWLYALPGTYAVLPPVLGAAAIWLVHRLAG